MEEDKKKLPFSIPSKPQPPKPTSHPATECVFSSADEGADFPAPQFVTELDLSQTLNPATAAAAPIIAPVPNSGHFLAHRAGNASSIDIVTPEEADPAVSTAVSGPTFVLDNSTNPGNFFSHSHSPYGLTLRSTATAAAWEKMTSPPAPPMPPATPRCGVSRRTWPSSLTTAASTSSATCLWRASAPRSLLATAGRKVKVLVGTMRRGIPRLLSTMAVPAHMG